MNLPALSIVALIAICLLGCDGHQEQTVSVAVTRSGAQVVGGNIRLYAARNCQGSFEESTLRDGKTAFARTVEIGGVGVIIDELSVCLGSGETWTLIFSSRHGPAPGRVDIACDLDKAKRQCTTSFDGRTLDETQEDQDEA